MNRSTIVNESNKYMYKSISSIINIYNSITPLPQGYKLKSSDNWCAAFVSSIFWKCGYKNFPFECSVGRMVNNAMKMQIWQENDGYTPNIGDCIVYDWNDTGIGDCTGWPDHIGIVTAVNGPTITVTEGNKSGKVGTRYVHINGRYIRGYITPTFDKETNNTSNIDITSIAKDVIRGKYGVMPGRKAKIESLGVSYDLVRAEVNRLLKR